MKIRNTKKIALAGVAFAGSLLCLFVAGNILRAQDEWMGEPPGAFGSWGWDWNTTGADAQRSSSIRNDRWISRATVAKPGPRLLYKISAENTSRQMNALSQPILVGAARGLTGFKSMGYVAGSGGIISGFDYDTGQKIWKNPAGAAGLQGAGTLACPGGITTGLTRPTPLVVADIVDADAGRGKAPGNLPGARNAGSAVGAPGGGAPIIAALAAAATSASGGPGRAGGGGGGGGGGRGGANGVYSLSTDGALHQLSFQQGFDISMEPAKFLPPNSNASGLIVVNGFAYVATANECGGAPNGVWALDTASPAKTVTMWKTNGGSVVGTAGPAFGTDGTVYAATSDGEIVSLEPKTLKLRDSFTPGKSEFNSSPVVFSYKGKDLIAVSNRDGKLYLLDSASLGGPDHHTPLAVSAKFTDNTTDFAPGALSTWQDSTGTRWVLVPISGPAAIANGAVANGAVVAFTVVDQGGHPSLEPAWVSSDLISPLTPVEVNGVVFALSSGEFHTRDTNMTAAQRVQRSQPAVLHAFDAFTGKPLWNSGKTITSFAPHSSGLSTSLGQIYVTTYDNSIYAFGFEEKE